MNIFARIMARDSDSYRRLIKSTDLNQKDQNGRSLLRIAIAYGSEEIALDLISRGIIIDQLDRKGRSELHNALYLGQFTAASALLDRGASVTLRDDHGNDALWYAATHPKRDLQLVERILKLGADPTVKNNAGRSVIDAARERNDHELISIIERYLPQA